jgi:hypothetical protein
MSTLYPAGTTTIRNLTPRFYYFLVVKPDSLVDDIPQKEYFVYRFKVSTSSKDGINSLKKYFNGVTLIECRALSDVEYATGNFYHPDYKNQNKQPLTFKLKEIPKANIDDSPFVAACKAAGLYCAIQGYIQEGQEPDIIQYPLIALCDDIRKFELLVPIIKSMELNENNQ